MHDDPKYAYVRPSHNPEYQLNSVSSSHAIITPQRRLEQKKPNIANFWIRGLKKL